MFFRLATCFFLLLFCGSCSYFSVRENVPIEINIDFKKVDSSPSFKECDALIDQEKTACFRETMYEQVVTSLQQFSFTTKNNIDEEVVVVFQIDRQGEISLISIESSNFVEKEIPELIKLISSSIANLPTIQPATKRGIPVRTQYKLPIRIKTR